MPKTVSVEVRHVSETEKLPVVVFVGYPCIYYSVSGNGTYRKKIEMRLVMTTDAIIKNLQLFGIVHIQACASTNTARHLSIS